MKIAFSVMFLLTVNITYAQTATERTIQTTNDWNILMTTTKFQMDKILERHCPSNITVDSFKIALIKGDLQVSHYVKKELSALFIALTNYGNEAINSFNLPVEQDDLTSDLFFYSGVAPNNPIIDGEPVIATIVAGAEMRAAPSSGILACVAEALGVDAIAMFSQSSASAWTWATIKKAFKAVAKKMLGPIGVAIAIIDFTVCMF